MSKDDFSKLPNNVNKDNLPLAPGYQNKEGEFHSHNDDGELIIDFGGDRDSEASEILKDLKNKVPSTNRDPGTGFPKELVWTTKDGRRIPIPYMEDSHIQNTIAFLRRRVADVYKRRYIAALAKGLMKSTFMRTLFDFGHADEMDYKIYKLHESIKAEAARIFDMDDDEFLREFNPQFPYLLQEAYRRKLIIETPPDKQAKIGDING